MTKILFIGLGTMGYPMAGHLKSQGHDIQVYNRTVEKSEKWSREFNGRFITDLILHVKNYDVICACVGNDDDVRELVASERGILKNMKHNSIFIDHTTASASIEREMFSLAKKIKVGYLDAPVSGGEKGAYDGKLTIMCGGEKDVYEKAKKVMDAYSQECTFMGSIGNGQLTKMANQICIAGILQGLSEAINFAQNSGIDTDKMLKVISKGAAGSWQLENRGKTMAEDSFDFGFAVDWMRKDLKICLEEAETNGSSLPLVSLVDQFYKDIQLMNGGRWDTSSLIRRLNKYHSTN